MKMSVSPRNAAISPSAAALSMSRSAVVPTGITLPPAARVAAISEAVAGLTSPHSACILCWSISRTVTGRKVPAPTCSVTWLSATPRAESAAIRPSSKCRLAVGAATAPGRAAQMVW
jgi:hypothetical protein